MVTTRRSSARAALATKTRSEPKSTSSKHSAAKSVKTVEKPCRSPSGSPDPPHDTLDALLAESDSELLDLSRLPPSTGNTPERTKGHKKYSSELKEQHEAVHRQTQILGRPITSNAGSAHNPINLLEDSPLPKSRSEKRSAPEPHQFVERHKKLYKRQVQALSRAPSRSTSGSPYLGDLSEDTTERTRRDVLASFRNSNRQRARNEAARPRQHLSTAQHTMQRVRPTSYSQWPHHGYEAREEPMVSREMSYSNFTGISGNLRAEQTGAFNNTTAQFVQLSECNATLTELLKHYPYSNDQEKLRADISTLASIQNRCVQDWTRAESQAQRKRSSDSAIDLSSDSESSRLMEEAAEGKEAEQEKRKEQDDAVRAYFSSHADIWQDGSGMGVSDVFGGKLASSGPAMG